MSLKDDFFEALRSVKKDIFGDPQNTDPIDDNSGLDSTAAEYGGAFRSDSAYNFTDPIDPQSFPDTARAFAPSQDAASDEDVLSAYNQVSSAAEGIDGDGARYADAARDTDDELHSPQDLPRSVELADDYDYGGSRHTYDTPEMYADDKTIISKNTVIRGALQTADSVRLLGQILGDVDCKSNIVVAGKIRGNTTAANAYIFDAQVDGSVVCDDAINISDDAWVLGNIRAQQAEIDGKIKGNLEIRHTVSIGATSSIIGNISTDELEIKRGAFINGQIMMYTPSRDVMDRFDHFEK